MNRAIAHFAASLALLFGFAAAAQDYPNRPITLVAPFAAGTGTDAVVRIVAVELAERLKQPVVVENRAGANSVIGTEYVARATSDGYTLLFGTSSSHSSNPSLFKALRYDPVKDFTAIAPTVEIAYLLLTNPTLPVKSVADLVAYAKANPDKLNYGTPNGPSLVVSESVRAMAGIKIVGVPYKSSAQALTDFLGGQVEMYVVDVPTALPLVQSGKARALAITTPQRSPLAPDVPALADTFPGIDIVSWGGIFGPANLPPPVVERLAREIRAAMTDKAVADKLAATGFAVSTTRNPADFAKYVEYQVGVWGKLVKQAGIEAQ